MAGEVRLPPSGFHGTGDRSPFEPAATARQTFAFINEKISNYS